MIMLIKDAAFSLNPALAFAIFECLVSVVLKFSHVLLINFINIRLVLRHNNQVLANGYQMDMLQSI